MELVQLGAKMLNSARNGEQSPNPLLSIGPFHVSCHVHRILSTEVCSVPQIKCLFGEKQGGCLCNDGRGCQHSCRALHGECTHMCFVECGDIHE